MKPLYIYKATVVKVKDGDTFALLTDLGFHTLHKTELRIRKFDAPETRRQAGVTSAEIRHGLEAKRFATDAL